MCYTNYNYRPRFSLVWLGNTPQSPFQEDIDPEDDKYELAVEANVNNVISATSRCVEKEDNANKSYSTTLNSTKKHVNRNHATKKQKNVTPRKGVGSR